MDPTPTASPSRKPLRLVLGLGLLGLVVAVILGGLLPRWWIHHYDHSLYRAAPGSLLAGLVTHYRDVVVAGSLGILRLCSVALLLLATAVGLAGLRAAGGRVRGLPWMHLAFGGTYLLLFVAWWGMAAYQDALHGGVLLRTDYIRTLGAEEHVSLGIASGHLLFSGATGYPLLGIVAVLAAHVACSTGTVYAWYGVELPGAAPGDRLLEFVRIGGDDATWARSVCGSLGAHLLVIILPFLLTLLTCCGPAERYHLPSGSGSAGAPPTRPVKIFRDVRYVLAKDSPYCFKRPEPMDGDVIKRLDEATQHIYTFTGDGAPGGPGKGGEGPGGFPGPPGGMLRFIRLRWDCRRWDDGFDHRSGNADRNFLRWYAGLPNVTFDVAKKGEARTIAELANFEEGFLPPFVYMTGEGRGRISAAEVEILRDYLAEGGMLLVDAGSAEFHRWFTSWVHCLTGNRPLVTIGDDDPIFTAPIRMNNISPLFPHGGRQAKAMGYKIQGRWAIFYHPGDMNDAWKDNAYKVPRRLRDNARQVAYNAIWYACYHYHEIAQKYRRK